MFFELLSRFFCFFFFVTIIFVDALVYLSGSFLVLSHLLPMRNANDYRIVLLWVLNGFVKRILFVRVSLFLVGPIRERLPSIPSVFSRRSVLPPRTTACSPAKSSHVYFCSARSFSSFPRTADLKFNAVIFFFSHADYNK